MASRTVWWITGGLAVAMATALPLVLLAAPQPVPQRIVQALPAAGTSFAAICKDDVVEDSRADPAWILASYEGDNCRAPVMPVAPDGRVATRAQIMAGMAAVKLHAARSLTFERCIADFVASRKTQAGMSGGRSFLRVETHRIFVSEKNRKLAASRLVAAINAFNAYGSDCAD